MIKYFLTFFLLLTSAQAKIVWEVRIIDAKQKIQNYKVKEVEKPLGIKLEKSKWNCFLSVVTEGETTLARSIDCRYHKGPAYMSGKLLCPKKKFDGIRVNTFAVAEEKGVGYVLELICSHISG